MRSSVSRLLPKDKSRKKTNPKKSTALTKEKDVLAVAHVKNIYGSFSYHWTQNNAKPKKQIYRQQIHASVEKCE